MDVVTGWDLTESDRVWLGARRQGHWLLAYRLLYPDQSLVLFCPNIIGSTITGTIISGGTEDYLTILMFQIFKGIADPAIINT